MKTTPGEPPAYAVHRISGGGDTWVAELVADYSDGRWYTVSVIEFDGAQIARMTDYFGPSFAGPRVASGVGRARRDRGPTR